MRNILDAWRRRAARHRRLSDRLDPFRDRQGADARPGDGRARQDVRHRHLFVDPRRFRRLRALLLSARRRWPTGSSWCSTATKASSRCARLSTPASTSITGSSCTIGAIREATVFRFPGTQQYKLEVETFARAAAGSGETGVHAGGIGAEPESHRRDIPRRRKGTAGKASELLWSLKIGDARSYIPFARASCKAFRRRCLQSLRAQMPVLIYAATPNVPRRIAVASGISWKNRGFRRNA